MENSKWEWIWTVIEEWSEMDMHFLSKSVREELGNFVHCQSKSEGIPPTRILPFGECGVVLEWIGEEDRIPTVRIEMSGEGSVVLVMTNRGVESEGFRIPSDFLAESTILGEILTGNLAKSDGGKSRLKLILIASSVISAAALGGFVLLRILLP
jgi:hypothetical protein